MASENVHDFTLICQAIKGGDQDGQRRLFELVYAELHRMAHRQLSKEVPGHTLQTTALVHEAYIKLFRNAEATWENRRHFFGSAARAMRQILVDHARHRNALMHGGDAPRVSLDECDVAVGPGQNLDILALDEALNRLASERPQHAEVVMYRYFLGLSGSQTADLLGVAPRTVDSHWQFAKTWLRREMTRPPERPSSHEQR